MEKRKMTPQERYDATHCVRIALKLNKRIDADILAWLDAQPTRQGAIKKLVRAQIAAEQQE